LREISRDRIKHNSSSTKRMIIFGAVGGIIAGLVMAPFLILTALLVGMPLTLYQSP